jgi:DNA-binding response OmpR family regulator
MAETKVEVLRVGDVEKGSETVLVVEDDPLVKGPTAKILRACGYAVIEAPDGEEAIKVFNENRDLIDLVILDIAMPKKSGKEVYGQIREVRPDAKVIFMSGYFGDSDLFRGPGSGMVDFLTKPVPVKSLIRMIRTVLDRQPSGSEGERAAVDCNHW